MTAATVVLLVFAVLTGVVSGFIIGRRMHYDPRHAETQRNIREAAERAWVHAASSFLLCTGRVVLDRRTDKGCVEIDGNKLRSFVRWLNAQASYPSYAFKIRRLLFARRAIRMAVRRARSDDLALK